MMNYCQYKGLNGHEKLNVKSSWTPFLRQLLICSGVWTSYFVIGLCTGAPTVFIPQIRKEGNSTNVISHEMASWLSSAINFSGFPCVIILSILSKFVGRRTCFIIACLDSFIGLLMFYCSTSVIQILISEIILGLFSAAQVVISIMIITEYVSPKYRGLFLTFKCTIYSWGIWAANAIGTYFYWKKIGLVAIVCISYTLLTIFFWPESPYWLASKERYKECAASHRWLKGCDEDAEKELEILISTQKEYIKSSRKEKLTAVNTIKECYVTFTSKEFYKPTLIAITTGSLSIFSGKLVCAVYSIDIIKKITDSEDTAYTGMLILDGITIVSMYIGCVLSKMVKRRSLLLVSSAIGVVFLFIISLYLFLIHMLVISEVKYVSVGLLTLFSIAISVGPMTVSTSVYGELIPIRSRNLAACIIALMAKFTLAVSLKTAPYLFKYFLMHGTFLYFGISSLICLLILYKYLPETKDKTLQEIADIIKGVPPPVNIEVSAKRPSTSLVANSDDSNKC